MVCPKSNLHADRCYKHHLFCMQNILFFESVGVIGIDLRLKSFAPQEGHLQPGQDEVLGGDESLGHHGACPAKRGDRPDDGRCGAQH